jgi:hypothetical protein
MARDAALVLTWTEIQPGREEKALQVLAETLEFIGSGKHEGIEGPDYYTNANNRTAMAIIRGQSDQLMQFRESAETEQLIDKINSVIADLKIDLFYGGPSQTEVEGRRERYTASVRAMGFVST